jgi:hypothetical protein
MMKKSSGAKPEGATASEMIDKRIADLGDWRGEMLGRVRALIKEADPDIVEEWKWMGTPIFSHDGIVCTGETYKLVVKLTFAKGASLKDPAGLFNSSLDGNVRRAIDIHEGEKLNVPALKALIRAAVELNASKKKPAAGKKIAAPTKTATAKKTAAKKTPTAKKTAAPKKTPAAKKTAPAKKAAPSKSARR